MSKADVVKGISYWRNVLKKYIDQSERSYILKSDLLPLWIGASVEDCIEWCDEEIRLLKEQTKK